MTDERRAELLKSPYFEPTPAPCGCVFFGSERDDRDCRGHVLDDAVVLTKREATALASAAVDALLLAAGMTRDEIRDLRCKLRGVAS